MRRQKVTFTCKDLVIQKYCDMRFTVVFQEALDRQQTMGGRDNALRWMARELKREAKRQEWYDWTESGDGEFVPHQRTVITDDEGKPVLLVPEVVLVDPPLLVG